MMAVIIPKLEATKYHQVKIEWWWGIDAIEKADGDFFLPERAFNLIPADFEYILIEEKVTLKTELAKLPIRELLPEELITGELMGKILKR